MKRHQFIISLLFFIVFSVFSSQKYNVNAADSTCVYDGYEKKCKVNPVWGQTCLTSEEPQMVDYCAQFTSDPDTCNITEINCDTCISSNPDNVCKVGSCGNKYMPSDGICVDPNSVCCIADNGTPTPTPTFTNINCFEAIIRKSDKICVCKQIDETFFSIPGCPEGTYDTAHYPDCLKYCKEINEGPVPTVIDDGSRFCNGKDESGGINTALGCIKVGSGQDLVVTILRLATGVGGGLALALILYGTFIVTTSAGIPDKLKAGGEIITSAIIGLIFILLSIFLVNLIGINILGIPGLT